MADGDKGVSSGTPMEGAFVGTFEHLLDTKRRLTIPSSWRDRLGASRGFYVLPDVESRCLCVLPAKEMARRLEGMGHHSIADTKARRFTRSLGSRTDLVDWDTQGRIRINDALLDGAGIGDAAVLLGNFTFFEIWSPAVLKKAGVIREKDLREAVRHVGF